MVIRVKLLRKILILCFLLIQSLSAFAQESGGNISLEQAVLQFNAKWEARRQEVGESRLTTHEVIAALQHAESNMSTMAQAVVDQIVNDRVLPKDARIELATNHNANHKTSYVWFIKLHVAKEPNGFEQKRTAVESIWIRMRYLASQQQVLVGEKKSLAELLE